MAKKPEVKKPDRGVSASAANRKPVCYNRKGAKVKSL